MWESRNPITWAISAAFQGRRRREAQVGSQSREWNPGVLIWDTSVLSSRINANSLPCFEGSVVSWACQHRVIQMKARSWHRPLIILSITFRKGLVCMKGMYHYMVINKITSRSRDIETSGDRLGFSVLPWQSPLSQIWAIFSERATACYMVLGPSSQCLQSPLFQELPSSAGPWGQMWNVRERVDGISFSSILFPVYPFRTNGHPRFYHPFL